MMKYYHVITERNDEYISTVAIAENIESVKAYFAGQNVREIIELNAAQVNTISAAVATTIIDLNTERDNAPAAPDYGALSEIIRAELNARHDRETVSRYEKRAREMRRDLWNAEELAAHLHSLQMEFVQEVCKV